MCCDAAGQWRMTSPRLATSLKHVSFTHRLALRPGYMLDSHQWRGDVMHWSKFVGTRSHHTQEKYINDMMAMRSFLTMNSVIFWLNYDWSKWNDEHWHTAKLGSFSADRKTLFFQCCNAIPLDYGWEWVGSLPSSGVCGNFKHIFLLLSVHLTLSQVTAMQITVHSSDMFCKPSAFYVYWFSHMEIPCNTIKTYLN
jgi:hypothetical protein